MKRAILCVMAFVAITSPAFAQVADQTHPAFRAARQDKRTFETYMATSGTSWNLRTANGRTLMHYAAQCQDSFSNVALLKSKGLNINAADAGGVTPLMLAASNWCAMGASDLVAAGADTKPVDWLSRSAMHYASMLPGINDRALAALISAKADINAKDRYGRTPLMFTIINNNPEGVKAFLAAGADTKIADKFGVTAGSLAAEAFGAKFTKKRDAKDRAEIVAAMQAVNAPAGAAYVEANYPGAPPPTAPKPAAGSSGRQIVIGPGPNPYANYKPIPVVCKKTTYENLTAEESAAVEYVMKQEWPGAGKRFCVEHVKALQKFPLRGQKVVKYDATLYFPNGYDIGCLGSRPTEIWAQMSWDNQCGGFAMGSSKETFKPQPPETRGQYAGEVTI